ncbi:hypothetical protein A1F99_118330 [Pyrenophora tritici-repentis]|nr:hypothetical protein A1F99_118330 [Pyrenophora tritici-repentis]
MTKYIRRAAQTTATESSVLSTSAAKLGIANLPCVCGLSNALPDCWILNPLHPGRPKDWTPAPIGVRKVEQAQKDPKISKQIKDALNEWASRQQYRDKIQPPQLTRRSLRGSAATPLNTIAQLSMEPPHRPGAARRARRNKTFHPAREPGRHEARLQLEHDGATGPLPFLNPTRAHYRHGARPDARFKWTSRNDRKGRHAVVIDTKNTSAISKHTTPRPTSSIRTVARNIWRMLTYCPVWDVSYDVAFVFTLGSVIWVINAFFVYLPLVQPGTEFKTEELYGGGITAFIGATVFEIGSVLLIVEAVNEGRSGCFGWVVEQAISHQEEVGGGMIWPSKSHCTHPHTRQYGDGSRHTYASNREQRAQQHLWVWWPTTEELRTHYIHNFGFLASLSQLLGASIFWVAGLTALPGIYNRISKPITVIFYWTPQVVGGLGFIISGCLFMLETQSKWWKPAPRTLGWWIGAFNLVGGIGFTMCPGFGYDSSSWTQYQASLSTFWGSWAFLIGSALQWYESLEKFPVESDRCLNGGSDVVDVHTRKEQS